MSDWTELILIGCIVIVGIFMSAYGLYVAISSFDAVTRILMFFPILFGLAISGIWSWELKRKYKELE